MRDQDREYDVAEPEPAHEEHNLPQRIRAEGIWRHLPDRTGVRNYPTTGDPTAGDETAPEDQTLPDAEAVPAEEGPPADEGAAERTAGIGRLVVAGDRPAEAEVNRDRTGSGPVNPIAADELAHEPIVDPPVLAEPAPARVAEAAQPEPGQQSFASEQWREIQASFVDDPRGAVQQAADAASAALSALVTTLREQQASMGPAAAHDTEQLRAAVQGYRRFCQALSDLGRMLPETTTAPDHQQPAH